MTTRMARELIWKQRYDKLRLDIQDMHERINEFAQPLPPETFISASEEFFISNDMDVVDSEVIAKQRWGNRYIRVVRP